MNHEALNGRLRVSPLGIRFLAEARRISGRSLEAWDLTAEAGGHEGALLSFKRSWTYAHEMKGQNNRKCLKGGNLHSRKPRQETECECMGNQLFEEQNISCVWGDYEVGDSTPKRQEESLNVQKGAASGEEGKMSGKRALQEGGLASSKPAHFPRIASFNSKQPAQMWTPDYSPCRFTCDPNRHETSRSGALSSCSMLPCTKQQNLADW